MYCFKLIKYSLSDVIKYTIRHIVGWLLHYANKDGDKQFYGLKNRLLHSYGVKVGVEMQHIKKKCWSCHETGVFTRVLECGDMMPVPCWRCYATGIYEEFWVRLDKYKIGKWYFHIPIERMNAYKHQKEGKELPIIEGYIRHKRPKHEISRECVLWLYLLFDRKIFWYELGHYRHRKIRTPLLLLNNTVFVIQRLQIDNDELPF